MVVGHANPKNYKSLFTILTQNAKNCKGLTAPFYCYNQNMKKGLDYIGVSVVYFCHDGKGNFLMQKRSKNCRDEHGRFDIGGGGVEFGVPLEENLRKEIKEEYGTDVIKSEFLGFRDVHRKSDGKPTHWVALDFKVLIDPAKVKNGEPHKFDEVGWFTFDTLPDPTHSQLPEFLKLYAKKLRAK
jgi:ADP-ribose pyrophosphatase YjhB (NUDIX family)